MGVKSGVPTTVNGVQVGATDFSEFAVAPGLPAGITAFGSGPTGVSIEDTPLTPTFGDEGKYFEMTGQPGNTNWAFGLDAFFGIMEQGEILIRLYFNINGVKNRATLGPCMSIEDSSGISGAQACVLDPAVSPPEVAGGVFIGGGDAHVGFFDIQEPIQDPEWMWFRARKTNNPGSPSEDDWQVTAWYGDLSDEPSSPDGIDPAPQSNTAPRGLFALGWAQAAFGAIVPQRIAFLSYSENPAVEPPPVPPLGAATIWTPFPAARLGPLSPKPVISDIEAEYDVRQLVLNDLDPVSTWPDSSGNARDATSVAIDPTYLSAGWDIDTPAVRIEDDDASSDNEHFSFDGSWIIGTALTWFCVVEATDLTRNMAIIGANGSGSPGNRNFNLFVRGSDGALIWNRSLNTYDLVSPPGTIVEGGRYIIVLRMDASGVMDMRVNGELVAGPASGSTLGLNVDWAATEGMAVVSDQITGGFGLIFGDDKLFAWISGYSVAASDEQIEQMEAHLAGIFGIDGRTQWTDQPAVSPGTVWANLP